jgi:hypothetical protein
MGTGKPRTNTAAAEPAGRVVQVELAPGRVPAELELVQVLAELELAQVLAEPELVQVVAELELGPVVALELEHDLVAAELELVQEEAVPARGHLHAQLAVALRTKSVTAAHRRDLVLRLEAVEDLAAAAAETTREPAAAEAVIAWEVGE